MAIPSPVKPCGNAISVNYQSRQGPVRVGRPA
jgi:hypothetical protein